MNDERCTICKRCGRKLKNSKSIQLGMGITCWKKWQNERNHKILFERIININK